MEERIGEAFAGTEHLTVIGKRLHPGETAPDFCLHYLDLVDLAVHTVHLPDLTGRVRLFSVVNSLERPVCQVVTRRWEALRAALLGRPTLVVDPFHMFMSQHGRRHHEKTYC